MDPPTLLERDHASVTLCWSKLPDEQAESYELQMRSSAGHTDWVTLSNCLKGSSIRKKNLPEGVAHSFRIRYKKTGEESWSDCSQPSEDFYVLPTDWQIMDQPEIVSKDDVSVTLQWKEVAGAVGYMVRFRADGELGPDGPWQKVNSVIKSTTVRKKGLLAGVTYFFSILPVFDASDDSNNNWSYSASSAPTKVATMAPFMQKLFPATLVTKGNKETPTSSLLSGKCVAIYFSAHWCGPCRQFTPKLLELYAQCKAQGKRFEVVFCSADHSEQEFQSYHASMAWPAIGFEEEHREGIMGMFKVSGIPRMVILSASGRVVSENAISGAPLSIGLVDQWIALSDSMK